MLICEHGKKYPFFKLVGIVSPFLAFFSVRMCYLVRYRELEAKLLMAFHMKPHLTGYVFTIKILASTLTSIKYLYNTHSFNYWLHFSLSHYSILKTLLLELETIDLFKYIYTHTHTHTKEDRKTAHLFNLFRAYGEKTVHLIPCGIMMTIYLKDLASLIYRAKLNI